MAPDSIKTRINRIIKILEKLYPDPKTALHFTNPLELLVATVLSAQCTDERVNMVTADLFKKYKTAKDYTRVEPDELEEDIRPTGFFRNKAKAIKGFTKELTEKYSGQVPASLDDLVSLPGVGRKTAKLVLGEAFDIPGIVVDTHVLRLSQRIGLSRNKDPIKVEFDLMKIVPKKQWTRFANLLILHGRAVCKARKPDHAACKIVDLCQEGLAWKMENKK